MTWDLAVETIFIEQNGFDSHSQISESNLINFFLKLVQEELDGEGKRE